MPTKKSQVTKIESLKLFRSKYTEVIEKEYNKWYEDLKSKHLAIGIEGPIDIRDRSTTLQFSGKTSYVLVAIFYVSYVSSNMGAQGDQGKHLDCTGVSAIGGHRR